MDVVQKELREAEVKDSYKRVEQQLKKHEQMLQTLIDRTAPGKMQCQSDESPKTNAARAYAHARAQGLALPKSGGRQSDDLAVLPQRVLLPVRQRRDCHVRRRYCRAN